MNPDFLEKEDYDEPCCPLGIPTDRVPIPVGRVMEKLDGYLIKKDYDAAERHLSYWLEEAIRGNDPRGRLAVLNEQIGFYRKTEREAPAVCAIESALRLIGDEEFGGTAVAGTTLINAATAYKSFGHAAKALPLYKRAEEIYETALAPDDARRGGLYNNMALTLAELGDTDAAGKLFEQALAVMAQVPDGQAEMAVTHCNLADLTAQRLGTEEGELDIRRHLEKAMELLDTDGIPHDGNYAYVCEKCAPTFGYYGYFVWEIELMNRAREIYEGT